jgi:hypothetical protein
VTVSGVGVDYEDARADAVRKAMQQVLPQLVIVERAINEDTILRDRVISTSNGFVDHYQELDVSESEIGLTIKAEITVSASRIENYIGVVTSGAGEFDGNSLGAEVQRRLAQKQAEISQRKAMREIYERVFERWPLAALNVELKGIDIHPTKPNLLVLDIEQTYKKSYIRLLESTLEALSFHECDDSVDFGMKDWKFWGLLSKTTVCPHGDSDAQKRIVREHVSVSPVTPPRFSEVCIAYYSENRMRCFLLEDGATLGNASFKRGGQLRPTTVAAFYDENGQNMLTNGRCMVLNLGNNTRGDLGVMLETRFQQNWQIDGLKYSTFSGFHLSDIPIRLQVEIPADAIDLSRAAQFVAVVGHTNGKGDLFESPLASSDLSIDICDAVEEAYRYSTTTSLR